MNILLTHAYSRKNKGDAAILSVMLKKLKPLTNNIKIATMENPKVYPYFENTENIPSFYFLSVYKSENTIIRILMILYILSATYVWVLLYKVGFRADFLLMTDLKHTINEFLNVDVIIPIGGGYLRNDKRLISNLILMMLFHPIHIGKLLNKKVILYSQSIGPFYGSFAKMLARFMLNKVDLIVVREEISKQILKELNIRSKIIKSVDAAFYFETGEVKRMKTELKSKGVDFSKKVVGVTMRNWLGGDKQNEYEKEMAETIKYITQKDMQVVCIPQVTSSEMNDDDRKVYNRIKKLVGKNSSVIYLDKDYDHFEIKAIYDNLDYFIGTRMHSCIFSLTSHKPVIAIEYEHKTRGIMKDLGLEEWIVKIEDVTSQTMTEMFDKLIAQKDHYTNTLKKNIQKYVLPESVEEKEFRVLLTTNER